MKNTTYVTGVCGSQMERARQYHAKLVNIKKEMCSLHEKTAQIKVC